MMVEVCGWFGGLLLIGAYAMVSFGRITAQGKEFQGMNLLGSLMMAANSAWHHAWPSVGVNFIWIGVGVISLARERTRIGDA